MELNKVKEIVEKYTIPTFPSNIQPGEWVEAISIVLDLLDAEVENRNTNKIAPCEHAGIDYFYYPLTDEWYIDLAAGEEHSLNLYINYCPICGRRLP